MTEAMNGAWSGFFVVNPGNEVQRRHVHNRSLLHVCTLCVHAHTLKHRNTCFHTGMSCTSNLCITVRRLFRMHENMLACQSDAYYGCLWRWKLTFSMVLSLKGGRGGDGDHKSAWSAYTVMAYYTPFCCGFALAVIVIPHHCIYTHAKVTHSWRTTPSHIAPCVACLRPTLSV